MGRSLVFEGEMGSGSGAVEKGRVLRIALEGC